MPDAHLGIQGHAGMGQQRGGLLAAAGRVAPAGTTRIWHLYEQGMRAIADVVLEQLTGSPAPTGTGPALPPAASLVTNPPITEG